jgi:polyhydroxyalkanoate synthesis regulator phasin
MAIRSNLKTQIDALATRVNQAEKAATKQVRNLLKTTEKFRSEQSKHVHALIKRAERLKSMPLAKKAEQLREQVEMGASAGLQFLMAKLNVPSRGEIDRLQKKISNLQKRIDDLEKSAKH